MKIYAWLFLLVVMQIHSSCSRHMYQGRIPNEDFDKYGLALDAIFGMGLRLQALVNQSTSHNFVVSPVSATVIVAQLLLGAKGEFQDQLYDLLSLPGKATNYNVNFTAKNENRPLRFALFHLHLSSLIKELQKRKAGEEFTLKQSSALFYNQKIKLNSDFKRYITSFYNSEITPLNFSKDTTGVINNWSSDHTNGLIKNVINTPPEATTSALFFNAVYFLAEWENPFSDMLNVDEGFYKNENDTVTATYMQGLIPQIPYAQAKDYRLVCLPYKNNELGMYILLPNNDNPDKFNIGKFATGVNPEELLETVTKMKLHDAVIKIPKLSLSNTLRLLEPLQKYAEFKKVKEEPKEDTNAITAIRVIEDNLNNFNNFTPPVKEDIYLTAAADDAGLRVSDIVQQMIFSINEKGTEAAAVTAGITDYMGGAKTMVFNRPFMFFIVHQATKATLFWGTIGDPSQS